MTAFHATTFERPAARSTDPHTSANAAVVAINNAARTRERVLIAMCQADRPVSDFDVEALTGIKQTSCGKRRLDLERAGFVTRAFLLDPDTCERVFLFGKSPTGTTCNLYEPTPQGREVCASLLASRASEDPR